MSATYRIETAHEPNDEHDFQPFIARIYRLSDESYVTHAWAATADGAEASARAWVVLYEASTHEPKIVHVDDQGRDAEAPQSVKVP